MSAPPTKIIPPPQQPMPVARLLARERYTNGDDLVLRDHRGNWYRYDGTCWPELDARIVRAAAYCWLEPTSYIKVSPKGERSIEPWAPSRRKVDDLLDALRAVTIVQGGTPPMWTDGTTTPPACEIVAVANGLLHVPTRTLYPHSPRFFTHHSLPYAYNADAPNPDRWLQFLKQLWPEDQTSIRALQEMFGYIVGGDTRQQKMFLLVGPKRGGKGTIGRVLKGLLGAHNVAAPTMASLSTNFGLQPLIDRPLALISDARLGGRTDGQIVVERLLSISGQDTLTIDRKYRESWTGQLPTRFVILTNELPRLSDSSGALASRFIIFVLTKSFYGREDPGLTDTLLEEAPGIFQWSLKGLDRLNRRGYFEAPESGKEAIQQLEDLASPIGAFLRDRCELDAKKQIAVEDLWGFWKEWCSDQNRAIGTKAVFGRDLAAAAPSVRRTRPGTENRQYIYIGLGPRTARTEETGSPSENGARPSRPRTSAMYPPHENDEELELEAEAERVRAARLDRNWS